MSRDVDTRLHDHPETAVPEPSVEHLPLDTGKANDELPEDLSNIAAEVPDAEVENVVSSRPDDHLETAVPEPSVEHLPPDTGGVADELPEDLFNVTAEVTDAEMEKSVRHMPQLRLMMAAVGGGPGAEELLAKSEVTDTQSALDPDEIPGPAAASAGQGAGTQDSRPDDGTSGASPGIHIGTVGGDTTINYSSPGVEADNLEKLLMELPRDKLSWVQRVFVASKDYVAKRLRLGESTGGICLIVGREHCGKYTAAVHLAIEAYPQCFDVGDDDDSDKPVIYSYLRAEGSSLSLIEFCRAAPGDRVYLIRDAFNKNIGLGELTGEEYDHFVDILEKKHVHLILTTELAMEQLAEIVAPKICVDSVDMGEILARHVDAYEEEYGLDRTVAEMIRAAAQDIVPRLQYPIHADLFCNRVSEVQLDQSMEGALLSHADNVTNVGRPIIRAWFYDLSENAKLYAMLIVLFEGLSVALLDEIYIAAVRFLRNDGLTKIEDPREIGLEDLRRQVQAKAEEGGEVTFVLPAYAGEIERQIKNHNLVLWSLHGVFIELMEQFSDPANWMIRQSLGTALGILGASHTLRLVSVLEQLGLHSSRPVAASAGFVMAETCRREAELRKLVPDLLATWARSHHPSLMWTSGAAIWRVYKGTLRHSDTQRGRRETAGLRKDLLDRLRMFAEHGGHFNKEARAHAWAQSRQSPNPRQHYTEVIRSWSAANVDGFVFAVRQVMRDDPTAMVDSLRDWLGRKNRRLRNLSSLACRILFVEGREPKWKPPQERKVEMLRLIEPLLEVSDSSDQAAAEEALMTARVWLEWGGFDKEIFFNLLLIANRADPRAAFRLRQHLASFWLDSEHDGARKMGQRLISRSLALQGFPMHPPDSANGVLVLDGSRKGLMDGISARAAVLLRAMLNTQLETSLLRLGRDGLLLSPEGHASSLELRREAARPRLLLPALERLNAEGLAFMLILSWGEIVDLEDLSQSLEIDDVRIVAVAYQPAEPGEQRVLHIESYISWSDLHTIETWLTWTLARRIAHCDYKHWQPVLSEYFGIPMADDRLAETLENRVKRLDDSRMASGKDDLVRLINCACLWWLDEDPEACMTRLGTWLEAEKSEPLHRIAVAAARQLFVVLSHRQKQYPDEFHRALLNLATKMIGVGWLGAEPIFYMTRHLLADEAWQESLLHGRGDLRQPLVHWFEMLLPEYAGTLRALLDVWRQRLIDEKEIPPVVEEVVAQLGLRISLGSEKFPEHVGAEKSYALIVIDGALTSLQMALRISQLTQELAAELDKNNTSFFVHRLGCKQPVAVAGEKLILEALLPNGLHGLPRLLSPVIERHRIDQVSSVMLLLAGEILDGKDLDETPWAEKLKVCSLTNASIGSPFYRIPPGSEAPAIARHFYTTA